MYHPGRVLKLFAPKKDSIGDGLQAMIDMWDENLFTFAVDQRIADKIKEGDVVLVDYNPMAANSPHLRRTVVKILRGKSGEDTWTRYRRFHQRQRVAKEASPQHDYMG